mmetsp:Transcript_92216/g.284981  ORF Transcript_92216/g.284981 Transcript_92216/m.284981 type:complete len:277 (-) Transcript_92216:47-877(-)
MPAWRPVGWLRPLGRINHRRYRPSDSSCESQWASRSDSSGGNGRRWLRAGPSRCRGSGSGPACQRSRRKALQNLVPPQLWPLQQHLRGLRLRWRCCGNLCSWGLRPILRIRHRRLRRLRGCWRGLRLRRCGSLGSGRGLWLRRLLGPLRRCASSSLWVLSSSLLAAELVVLFLVGVPLLLVVRALPFKEAATPANVVPVAPLRLQEKEPAASTGLRDVPERIPWGVARRASLVLGNSRCCSRRQCGTSTTGKLHRCKRESRREGVPKLRHPQEREP